MKKYNLTLIALFFFLAALSQYPSFNGISTNPANPINNELPLKKNTFFDWQLPLWPIKELPNQGNCTRTNLVTSPFFRLDNVEELRQSKDMK
jgi:hypothetical protein